MCTRAPRWPLAIVYNTGRILLFNLGGDIMNKGDLTCSIAMTRLLSSVPEDAEIGSVAVFVGVKGGGVYMGSTMADNPQKIASMISAFSEAKRSILENIIREHGMEMMVSVMF